MGTGDRHPVRSAAIPIDSRGRRSTLTIIEFSPGVLLKGHLPISGTSGPPPSVGSQAGSASMYVLLGQMVMLLAREPFSDAI